MTEFTTKLHQVLRRHFWNHFWLCDCHSTESNQPSGVDLHGDFHSKFKFMENARIKI